LRKITYAEAIAEALREEMLRDERVYICGEDVGAQPSYGASKGLLKEFGEMRVKDTPISETAIIGSSVGAAMAGCRPVAEIMFASFLGVCMDEIYNQAANMRYMMGGQVKMSLVIRTPLLGGGLSAAAQHSGRPESWFIHIPGLKVAIPSTCEDVKGLLKTAIRDDNPVIFFEHVRLYHRKGSVPEGEYTIPFGRASISRKGRDVTIVATSLMVHESLEAAKKLEKQGISVEVIDPRTLVPFDKQTVIDSVKKTARLVIVSEDCKTGGIAAEISATVVEEAFDYLDAPIKRVCALDVPLPFSPPLEKYAVPDQNKIIKAVQEIC